MSEPAANDRCVVICPTNTHVVPGCERGLAELERRGYVVWRLFGTSAIDQARCQAATDALARGFDELMWIDSDIVFDPDDVERLRSHGLPMTCGIYAKKGARQFASVFAPGTNEIHFGEGGGLIEVTHAAFGFTHTRRSVFETMESALDLPICNERFGRGLVPYFMPMVLPVGGEDTAAWYLAEDYAFSERARRSGFRILADTTIRLWHVGSYAFGWEDAGADKERFDSYLFRSVAPTETEPSGDEPADPPATEVADDSEAVRRPR